jgi:hypothetical protein
MHIIAEFWKKLCNVAVIAISRCKTEKVAREEKLNVKKG